ncbi:hypothetical protein RB653_003627 [Dictyostelium firmibasis]|uniref:SET domain-containing protein n=1 Tax=Dictyostelium firmibasis TaxID=79012 RepID=A0AAN7U9B7_9MYCE
MTNTPNLKDLGNQFYTKGDYDKAIELYKQGIQEILDSNKTNEESNNQLSLITSNLSISYYQIKRYQESLETALKSIEYNPKSAKPYLRAGDAYIALSNFKDAKEKYLLCIKNINTNDETAKNLLTQASNSLQNAKMKQFYQPILEGSPSLYNRVEIKYLDGIREKALFAKVPIEKGEIIFSDLPFIHQLSVDSFKLHHNDICSHCIKFIDTAPIKCDNSIGCKYQYCSENCKSDSFIYHSQSCMNNSDSLVSSNHPISKYRAMVENVPTSTQLLLVESLISKISYLLKTKQAKNCNLALGTITHLKRGPLMAQQSSFNGKNLEDLQKQYQPLLSLLEEAYGLKLKEHLDDQLLKNEFKKLFSVDFYDNLLGMINFNSTSTVIKSGKKIQIEVPVVTNNKTTGKGKKSNNNQPKTTTKIIENSCWGVGLFPIFSCMNHSCIPNVEISNEIVDGVTSVRMVVKAKKNIPAGSEILHSYCDETLSNKERKDILFSQYGFKCTCNKCSK